MNEVKFISFEMMVEFDIGETDYHVMWSSDEGNKETNDTDETKEETKETSKFQIKSENDEGKEGPTNLDNLMEKEKNEEKEDTAEKNPDETILKKKEDDDSKAVNVGRDDDNQNDSQQISDKKGDEENKISDDPTASKEGNGFNTGNDDDDNRNDMDQTEDMKVNEMNCQEEDTYTMSEDESPEDDDGVKSSLPVKEESIDNVEDDIRQYILELGAGTRKIVLARKSSESNTAPVFGQSTEGLEPEEMKNFGEAWAEAVFLCLERRVAVGHTVDEVMQGMVEELGLDKFQEIVEHFLGSMTVEQLKAEDGPEENGNEADDEQK